MKRDLQTLKTNRREKIKKAQERRSRKGEARKPRREGEIVSKR